ncbi:hypothetical protein PanWU01x14_272320 [Parasponia andersonii]|uniref:Uncharacterized protein n=1 Tax=Parasponia andersonii TaxID=3476 RepID=A0A2P5B4A2_PARAD|nr:hypothetical protein PanWU01x14_272320 [Parasponia andersonii]
MGNSNRENSMTEWRSCKSEELSEVLIKVEDNGELKHGELEYNGDLVEASLTSTEMTVVLSEASLDYD